MDLQKVLALKGAPAYWPTELAVPSSSPAPGELFSTVYGVPLHTAFHYHTPIALIWPKYCWKGLKIANQPSIHLALDVWLGRPEETASFCHGRAISSLLCRDRNLLFIWYLLGSGAKSFSYNEPCETYSIIGKIDILLDVRTGNKRVWRAENIKWFINIVKFPQFIQPFFHLNTYLKKEKLLQILNPFALDR